MIARRQIRHTNPMSSFNLERGIGISGSPLLESLPYYVLLRLRLPLLDYYVVAKGVL